MLPPQPDDQARATSTARSTRPTCPVYIEVGQPASQERSLADVWSALGGELKPSLDVVVTAPIVVDSSAYFGPPVLEGPSIGISSTGGAAESRRGGAPRARRDLELEPSTTEVLPANAGRQGRRRADPGERRPATAPPVTTAPARRRRPARAPAPGATAADPAARPRRTRRSPTCSAAWRWSRRRVRAAVDRRRGRRPRSRATASAACTSPTSRSTGCSTGAARAAGAGRGRRRRRPRARATLEARGRGRARPTGATSGCATSRGRSGSSRSTSSCCWSRSRRTSTRGSSGCTATSTTTSRGGARASAWRSSCAAPDAGRRRRRRSARGSARSAPLVAGGLLLVEDADRPFLTRSLRVPTGSPPTCSATTRPDPLVAALLGDVRRRSTSATWRSLARGAGRRRAARVHPRAAGRVRAVARLRRRSRAGGRPAIALDLGAAAASDDPRADRRRGVARGAAARRRAGRRARSSRSSERGAAAVRAFAEQRRPGDPGRRPGLGPGVGARAAARRSTRPSPTSSARHELWLGSLDGDAPDGLRPRRGDARVPARRPSRSTAPRGPRAGPQSPRRGR